MKTSKKDNGEIDWKKYELTRISAGEICFKCKGFIIGSLGYKSLCKECEQLSIANADIYHSVFIRCPYCGQMQKPFWENHYGEGLHTTYCKHCDKEYEFTTIIERSFRSSKMIVE